MTRLDPRGKVIDMEMNLTAPKIEPFRVLLRYRSAAKALDVGLSTLDEWVKVGWIKVLHIRARRYVSVRELRRFARRLEQGHDGDPGTGRTGAAL